MTDNGRRQALDTTAAQALLEQAERQREIRQMPRKEQRAIKKAQEKAQKDADRSRAYYDLSELLKQAVNDLAQQENISASNAAALLLADGICRYREGSITLEDKGVKRLSPSPKHTYVVDDKVVLAVLRGSLSLENNENDREILREFPNSPSGVRQRGR